MLCNDEPKSQCNRTQREFEDCTSNSLQNLCNDDQAKRDPRVGDGYCDDIFNWHVCDFDGGDCCETNTTKVNAMFCDDCFCLQNYTITDKCYFKSRVGNGICDDLANSQECSYDGGN